MGNCPNLSCDCQVIWCIFCPPIYPGYGAGPLPIRLSYPPLGMCESCVAPILILVISMFYKKNEQVGCHTSGNTGLTQSKATRIAYFYMMVHLLFYLAEPF